MSVDFALVAVVLEELAAVMGERGEEVARPSREAHGVEAVRVAVEEQDDAPV